MATITPLTHDERIQRLVEIAKQANALVDRAQSIKTQELVLIASKQTPAFRATAIGALLSSLSDGLMSLGGAIVAYADGGAATITAYQPWAAIGSPAGFNFGHVVVADGTIEAQNMAKDTHNAFTQFADDDIVEIRPFKLKTAADGSSFQDFSGVYTVDTKADSKLTLTHDLTGPSLGETAATTYTTDIPVLNIYLRSGTR